MSRACPEKRRRDFAYATQLYIRRQICTAPAGIGTGVVASSLIDAYSAAFPSLSEIANRGRDFRKAKALADAKSTGGLHIQAVKDLYDVRHD